VMTTIRNIVVIVGSLRNGAFSLKVANALTKHAPANLKLQIVTLHKVSMFNQDLEAAPPQDWIDFRNTIKGADGIIICTPEYNRSIPGVLKNAIDVASRPWGQSSFNNKPIGLVGSSIALTGGVNAVKHLQQILPEISGPILQQPGCYLSIGDAFDANGDVVKEPIKDQMGKWLASYSAHVELAHRK